MSKLNFSLSKKALLAIAVILLPVLVVFTFSYFKNKEFIRSYILGDLTVISGSFEARVYQFLEMSKRRAEDFASDGFIKDELAGISSGRKSASVLNEYLRKKDLQLDKHLTAIYVITPGGRVAASTDASSVGKDVSGEPFFLKTRSGVSVSENAFEDLPALAVSAPVTANDSGKPIGVITNFILLDELEKVLSGEFPKELGAVSANHETLKTLKVYLINEDRLMIAGPSFSRRGVLNQRVETKPVEECLGSGKELAGFYTDFRGVEVAGASVCLPSLRWTLLVEIDSVDALTPIFSLRRNAIVTGMIVAGVIGLLFFIFYRQVVLQLRKISSAAKSIAGGRYDVSIPVNTNDEIGLLSESFNTMASDIQARNKALKESEERLNRAQQIAHLGSWDWDIIENRLFWSDEIYRIFGIKPHEFGATYEAFIGFVHPEDRDFVKQSVYEALYEKKPYSIEHRILHPDGALRTVHEEADVTFNEKGLPVRMIGTVQDITERKETEYEHKKLSMAIEHSVNIVFITSAEGKIEYVNPMFEKVTGYSKEEAIGQTPRILSSGEVTNEQYEDLWKTILSGKTWRNIFKNKKKSGGYYWCNSVVSPIKDERGKNTHFLAVQEDITDKMLSEEKIKYLAQYDELTGLINRARFMELLQHWIGFAEISKETGALFLIDIDQFKFLNDTYGHGLGDEYLRRISGVIKASAERVFFGHATNKGIKPLVGRLSGDEFAIFLPTVYQKESLDIAEEVRVAVEESRFSDLPDSLTISIGIVLYPDHGSDTKALFTKADAAMYRAKELGRNRHHLYRPEDQDLEKMHSRLSWKEKITRALREGRFEPWFQPILGLNGNRIEHYEALARMRDESGGVLLPGAFIDIAERFGLIGSIDRMIIEKTIALQGKMRRSGRSITFSMNVSGKDLGDEDLLSFIEARIGETGADPNSLIFEITETAAISDIMSAKRFINSLQSLGCHFSLDDFGVGFTSFVYLKELKVDYIKIDGSFIKKLHENPEDQVFVKAITDVARGLKVKTVAEFVEVEETLELLRKYGVDYAQGYLIGKPAPDLLDDTLFSKKGKKVARHA